MIDGTFLKVLGLSAFVLLAMPSRPAAAAAPGVVDILTFGDAASEKAHHFEGRDTKAVAAALGEPARPHPLHHAHHRPPGDGRAGRPI